MITKIEDYYLDQPICEAPELKEYTTDEYQMFGLAGWARISRARASISICTRTPARAPTSAAKNRRYWNRSKANVACRAYARRSPPWRAPSNAPPS